MLFDQRFGDGADDAGGVVAAVDLAEDERSLDEGGVLIRKGIWVSCTGGAGKVSKTIPLLSLVLGRDGVHGVMLVRKFRGRIDELASLEIWTVEPVIKDIEDGKEVGPRLIVGQAVHRGIKRFRFPFLAKLEGGDEQIVATFKMLVEGRFGNACSRDDLVDADGLEAIAVDHLDRGVHEAERPLARRFGDAQELDERFVFFEQCHAVAVQGLTSSTPGG
jgi:hypothetical protein